MRIKTQVTWLKMKEKPPQTEHKTCGRGFELKIVKLTQPTVEDYRFSIIPLVLHGLGLNAAYSLIKNC